MTSCFSKHTSGSRLKHLWLWLEEWSGNAAPPPVRWVLSDLQTCVSCLNNTKKYMRNHRCPALFDVWQHPFSRVVYTLILHLTRLQHYPTSTEIRAQIEPCIYNRVRLQTQMKPTQPRPLCLLKRYYENHSHYSIITPTTTLSDSDKGEWLQAMASELGLAEQQVNDGLCTRLRWIPPDLHVLSAFQVFTLATSLASLWLKLEQTSSNSLTS